MNRRKQNLRASSLRTQPTVEEIRGLRKATSEAEFKAMYEGSFETEPTKYMIVAEMYRQARDFARVMGIPMKDWRFVEAPDDFRGYRDFVIVTLGGLYRKDRVYEILDAASQIVQMKYAKLIHVEDWR